MEERGKRDKSIYQICSSYRNGENDYSGLKAKRAAVQCEQRYSLPGTGRIAFGSIASDRPLFKPSNHSETKPPSKTLESEFSHMDIEGQANSPAVPAIPVQSTQPTTTPSSNDRNNSGRVSNKRPFPPSNTSAAPKPQSAVAPTGNPYLINNAGRGRPMGANSTTVAGQAGKLAAMARLAALGEDWPEEEDLPGLSMPVSSSLAPSNSAVMKEARNSMQRQQKVVIAKRKK